MSGAASPTANIKEAMGLVMGMFNTSLNLEKPPPSEDVPMSEPDLPTNVEGMSYDFR